MASGNEQLYFRADDDLREKVNKHKNQCGFEHQSEATRDLVKVGLREQQNPIVYRLKGKVIDTVGDLGVIAVVAFLMGSVTTIITFREGVLLSFLLIGIGLLLLGFFELTRVALGMNAVGDRLRSVLARWV